MDKKNKILLVLCFIASLLLGIILSAALLLTPILAGNLVYLTIIGILISISLLAYFSFSSFDIQEKTILFLTLPISIIISIATYIANNYLMTFVRQIESLQQQQTEFGLENIGSITSLFDFANMLNIWVLIVFIIIIYNILSIVFILFKKQPRQQISQ